MLILIFLDISTYKMKSEVFSNDGVLVRAVGGGYFYCCIVPSYGMGDYHRIYDHIIRAT